MSVTRPEDMIVAEIVGDLEIPCDYAPFERWCPDEPAAWILHRVRCECGNGGQVLACSPCKDRRLLGDGMVTCGECGAVTPVRESYSFFEPINKSVKR